MAVLLLLAFSGGVPLWLAGLAWRERRLPVMRWAALGFLCMAGWALSGVPALASRELGPKVVLTGVRTVFPTGELLAWLAAMLMATGRGWWLRRWPFALLCSVPLVCVALAVTSWWQPYWGTDFRLVPVAGVTALRFRQAPAVWVFLAWHWGVVTGLIVLLALYARQTHTTYQKRMWPIYAAVALHAASEAAWYGWLPSQAWVYVTPFMMGPEAALLGLAIFRHRLRVGLPVARAQVVEQLPELILVFDGYGHLVDTNPAAEPLLAAAGGAARALGRPAAEALASWPALLARLELGRPGRPGNPGIPGNRERAGPLALALDGTTREFEVACTAFGAVNGAVGGPGHGPGHGAGDGAAGQIVLLRDVTDRLAAERARAQLSSLIAQERATLAAVMDSMAEGIVVVEAGGIVRYCNAAAAGLLGVSPAQAIGRADDAVLAPLAERAVTGSGVPAGYRNWSDTLAQARHAPVELVFPGRPRRTVAALVFPVIDSAGDDVGYGLLLRDVTAERARERTQEEFTSLVSHELRTPLGRIRGFSTLLLDPEEAADERARLQDVRQIQDASDELLRLVDHLLDASRMRAGTFPVAPQPLALAPLLRAAVRRARRGARRRAIRLELPAGLPNVQADAHCLERVLANLLDNAVKYTAASSVVRLSAQVLAGAGDGAASDTRADEWATMAADTPALEITVEDDGPGIPVEEQAGIFERYQRGRAAREQVQSGVGLGLATARWLVEAQGGRLWLESPVPRQPPGGAPDGALGSAFHFTLPLAPAPPGRGAARPRGRAAGRRLRDASGGPMTGRPPPAEAPLILAIEDDPGYQTLLARVLRRHGYRVALASTGELGLAEVGRVRPDLVLLDMRLPDLDGDDVLRRLRERSPLPALPALPVIVLTARADRRDKIRGLDLGADDYVTKPFDVDELLSRIGAVLRRAVHGDQGNQARQLPPECYRYGDLAVDLERPHVTLAGAAIACTPLEYQVLHILARNAGRVVVHEELLRRVWGAPVAAGLKPLHLTILRLRRKLGDDPKAPRYLATVHGVGYRMPPPDGRHGQRW